MGTQKTFDMFMYLLIQYLLPAAQVPDLFMAIARNRLPVFSPLTGLAMSMSMLWMYQGLKRFHPDGKLRLSTLLMLLLQTMRGTIYMFHWLVVMPSITARMSVRPKRLKWVKTVHQGKS